MVTKIYEPEFFCNKKNDEKYVTKKFKAKEKWDINKLVTKKENLVTKFFLFVKNS